MSRGRLPFPLVPLAAACALLAGTARAGSPPTLWGDTVLARIDADSVTTTDLVQLLSTMPRPRPGTTDADKADPDKILRRLIQNRLLEQEGYRIGAQDDPTVRNQVWELTRHRAMLALLDSVSADVERPDAEEFAAAFDRENVMHRVSHIVVASESLATAILDSLEAGAPFEELSRRHSLDSTRADTGGDLGWARADLYIPGFQEALRGASKGDLAGPVKSDQGWHVLLLADTHTESAGQSPAMREKLLEAAMRERVMERVRSYVESLKAKHGIVLNDSLVATLDYGSEDPEVAQRLWDSDEVIAVFPWRRLTVGELSRRIRFEHFHGLQGKPDAAAARDGVFDEWVTELVLRHEAAAQGFDRRPAIVAAANRLEREALREVVVKMILDRPFDPSPEEVEGFYREHAEKLTPAPRLRVAGAHLADEESAREFRRKVETGADLAWLARRSPGVIDPSPDAYAGWVSAASLGLEDGDPEVGAVLGPLPVEEGWAVLVVSAVEPVAPPPLEQCRDRVVSMMTMERSQEVMSEAVGRLEEQADVRIEEGALDQVAMWIDEWAGVSTTPAAQ